MGTLDAGHERHWNFQLGNRSVDTMDLTLHLERDGAFAGHPKIRHFTLDALCEMFGAIPARPPHAGTSGANRSRKPAIPSRRLGRFAGAGRMSPAGRTQWRRAMGGAVEPAPPDLEETTVCRGLVRKRGLEPRWPCGH